MNLKYESIPHGCITSPKGFFAGAIHTGMKIKGENSLDLGILYSEALCVSAGAFTTNRIKAAPIVLCQERLANRKAQAIVVNSGCANACTGEKGLADATEMADLTARRLGVPPREVLVASTGVIGVPLPMEHLLVGIEKILLSQEGGHELAEAIMTTDTFPKEVAVGIRIDGKVITIGGVAKGAGMICPDLATLLCFLTTDAAIDTSFAQKALQRAVDESFNMLTIDSDTSTNDTVLFLANGLAGNEPLRAGTVEAEMFQNALQEVCLYLAKCIARDGEGATKLIEVRIDGALTLKDARIAAHTIAGSPLVKTAIHGNSPNWGRIIAALGRSGAEINPSRLDLYLKDICLLKNGNPAPFPSEEVNKVLCDSEVHIRVCLNLGGESATAWGCDLSEEYVSINSDYVT